MKISAPAAACPRSGRALVRKLLLILRVLRELNSSKGEFKLISASVPGNIPFDYGRSYQYPREVWRPTRVEIRCAVGPGSALPARTSDPAEDPRPRPRRHIVPANKTLIKLPRHADSFVASQSQHFARAK